MLIDFLRGRETTVPATQLRLLLQSPWCFPADDELAKLALQRGLSKPSDARPGEVLLLSVGRGRLQNVLWRLTQINGNEHAVGFCGSAQESLELAHKIISRDLPFLVRPELLTHQPRWMAYAVAWELGNSRLPRVLDGPSFGLSMCLAAASLALDAPVPSRFAASATVAPDGSVGRVEGLHDKIGLLARWALGVRVLLVARSQLEEAREYQRQYSSVRELTIEGIDTVSNAIAKVFPDLPSMLRARWRDPANARASAAVYRRVAIESRGIVGWGMLERTAKELCEVLEKDSSEQGKEAFKQAQLAQSIARRHEGHRAPIEFPCDEVLREMMVTQQRVLLAHVVQSAADDCDESAHAYLDKAAPYLPSDPKQWECGALRLAGAMGRALAAVEQYDRAIEKLRAAVQGWFDLFEEHQSSHALCEWARVLGVTGRKDELQQAERYAQRFAGSPLAEETSRCFVRLAFGRAWTQLGDAKRALEYLLDGVSWPCMPNHLLQARYRWLVRAHLDQRQDAEAKKTLELMDDGPQKRLAELDWACAREGDVARAVRELLDTDADKAHEFTRIAKRRRHESDWDLAQHLRNACRY